MKGWESCYRVSSYGRVWTLPRYLKGGRYMATRRTKGMMMRPFLHDGYQLVHLKGYGRRAMATPVHHIVAHAFLPPPPGPVGVGSDRYGINHKDGVKANNRADNLEWVTPRENNLHALRMGLRKPRAAVRVNV